MRAKICGITNLDDANCAIQYGAWALGFNFFKQSPRFIEYESARQIIAQLPMNVLKVGIFIQTPAQEIKQIMDDIGLSLAQVYEDLDCDLLFKKLMIWSLKINSAEELPSLERLSQYRYVLIDAPWDQDNRYGGTGKAANFSVASLLSSKLDLILAGGLTPDNIEKAMQIVQPFAVDVCSGIERIPGYKDHEKLKYFLEKVKNDE